MKTQKVKRYRLCVSRRFLKTHPRKDEPTFFIEKIFTGFDGIIPCEHCYSNGWCDNKHCIESCLSFNPKLHTCRGNYELWKKRTDEVQRGQAVIELFYWSASPYNSKHDNSKQVVFATLDKDSGCGVQRVVFIDGDITRPLVGWDIEPETTDMAKNDGLSLDDFKAWFEGYDLSLPMAIIHFTKFRYY